MFRLFSLLLLVCLVYHSRNTDIPVSGKKGGNITLTCEFEANTIVQVDLSSESGNIDVCQTEECSGRVFKQAACDVVIKNLSFSDAGKYTLRVYYKNDQTNVAQKKDRMYQLHIHGKFITDQTINQSIHHQSTINKAFTDNDAGTYRVLDSEGEILITVTVTGSGTESTGKLDTDKDKTDDTEEHDEVSVKISEELKLDVLLPKADKKQHQSRRRRRCKEVWKRTDGVQSERMTISDGNLIISHFTASDAGTYRVLDPDEEPLITVKVRESKEKLDDTDKDKTDDTKYRTVGYWIVLTLVLILTAVTLHKRRHIRYLQSVI